MSKEIPIQINCAFCGSNLEFMSHSVTNSRLITMNTVGCNCPGSKEFHLKRDEWIEKRSSDILNQVENLVKETYNPTQDYRFVRLDEDLQKGDELLLNGRWTQDFNWKTVRLRSDIMWIIRRKIFKWEE